jgi:hypothetical protein
MDAEERRRVETSMAKISREKRAVEADPAAAMQASLDAAMAKVKRRSLKILFCVVLAAAAVALYLRSRS